MDVNNYKYLWDGSEPGWVLHHIDHTVWHIVFEFGNNGPDKADITKLHHLLPEFQNEKLPNVYRKLKGTLSYRTDQYFGNIEAKELQEKASTLGFNINLESRQIGGYIPVDKNNMALVIEDDEIAKIVQRRMLDAGVKVVEIHVD